MNKPEPRLPIYSDEISIRTLGVVHSLLVTFAEWARGTY